MASINNSGSVSLLSYINGKELTADILKNIFSVESELVKNGKIQPGEDTARWKRIKAAASEALHTLSQGFCPKYQGLNDEEKRIVSAIVYGRGKVKIEEKLGELKNDAVSACFGLASMSMGDALTDLETIVRSYDRLFPRNP